VSKTALITGATGQDGSYLAEFLLEVGYEVHDVKRGVSLFNTERVDDIGQGPYTLDGQQDHLRSTLSLATRGRVHLVNLMKRVLAYVLAQRHSRDDEGAVRDCKNPGSSR
jgi:GDP-D-mannose dehydratase